MDRKVKRVRSIFKGADSAETKNGWLRNLFLRRGTNLDHARSAELQAERWRLIDHLVLQRDLASAAEPELWRRHDDSTTSLNIGWRFLLDAVEADRRSRSGDVEGAVTLFRRVVADLRNRDSDARNSQVGRDHDGNDIEFLSTALAISLMRLARLLVSGNSPEQARVNEALSLTRDAVAAAPGEIYIRTEQVSLLLGLGQLAEAEQEARRAAAIASTPKAAEDVAQWLGYVLCERARRELGDDEAATTFAEAEELLGSFGKIAVLEEQGVLHMGKDRAYAARDKFHAALEVLEAALVVLGREDEGEQAQPQEDRARRQEERTRLKKSKERLKKRLVLLDVVWPPADVLFNLAAATASGQSGLSTQASASCIDAEITDLVTLAADFGRHPEVKSRLHLYLADQKTHRGRPARDVAREQLQLFTWTGQPFVPFVSLVSEIAVELDPRPFASDGGTNMLKKFAEKIRSGLSAAYGIDLPPVRFRETSFEEGDLGYLLVIRESTVIAGYLRRDRNLYVGPTHVFRAAKVPSAPAPPGLSGDSKWASLDESPHMEELGLRHISPTMILLHHLTSEIEANLGKLVGREAVHKLIRRHGLGEATSREVGAVTRVMTVLLSERIPIHPFDHLYTITLEGYKRRLSQESVLQTLRRNPLMKPRAAFDVVASLNLDQEEKMVQQRQILPT